jgi:predicted MPP superfamily phosphohydrolase
MSDIAPKGLGDHAIMINPLARLTRRGMLRLGVAGLLGGAGVGLYTWRIEPHWVEVVQRELPIRHLPDSLDGKILVQLSDLHIGPQVADDFLIESFELVRQLSPEIVVITGDFMTCKRGEEIPHALRVLEKLPHGRLGTVASLGNHDYGETFKNEQVADNLSAGLANLGIRPLRNESTTIAGLTVAGLDDLWAPNFDLRLTLANLPKSSSAAHLMLCHNPDAADMPGWQGYQGWILCGHTHGGQCKAPLLTPPRLPVYNRRYVAGEVDLGNGRRLYINRALGHLLRVRFNVRPEITAFTLRRDEQAAV